MQHPRSHPIVLDYGVENDATEIDAGPHWSEHRKAEALRTISPARPLVLSPLARPVQKSAVQRVVALPPPHRAPAAFYSYAEEAARQHGVTERVPVLPISDLESPWLTSAWTRFAGAACGLIAALIFVVGYLAYSSQHGPVTTAAPAPAIVMPVEVAVSEEPAAEIAAPASLSVPTVPTVPTASARQPASRTSPKRRANQTTSKAPSKAKRRPITFDTSTALGNLRPSRD